MGYMRHHAIIVTSWNEDLLERAHAKALEVFEVLSAYGGSDLLGCVTPIAGNGMVKSFAVTPDGSKEGWTLSNDGDAARAELVRWLDEQRHEDDSTSLDWVEVQFADDDHETIVVNDSDARRRRQ